MVFILEHCIISNEIPYGATVKLGVWEKYDIFWLTNSNLINETPIPYDINVFSDEIKKYFCCLKANFSEFSENYLIYYIKSKLRINEKQGDSFKTYLLNGKTIGINLNKI